MGGIFFPQPLLISPSLQSDLPVEGREGGGRWQQNPVTPDPHLAPSHSTVFPSTEGKWVTLNKGRYHQPGPAAA